MAVSSNLDARYGRTPGSRLRDKRVLWIVGGMFALVLTAWVVWAGLDGAGPAIETRDIGYSIADENSVSVTFEVSLPPQTPAACAVQALNKDFTVVGWKILDLEPSEQYTRSFTEVVKTTDLSDTGLIYRCWLT